MNNANVNSATGDFTSPASSPSYSEGQDWDGDGSRRPQPTSASQPSHERDTAKDVEETATGLLRGGRLDPRTWWVWVFWAITHTVGLKILQINTIPEGDVHYYFRGVAGVDPAAMQEYPAVGVWPVEVLHWLIGHGEGEFFFGFIVLTFLVDAAFLAVILHSRSPYRQPAAYVWSTFAILAPHTQFLRLDIFTGVMVGIAGFAFFTHPKVSATLFAWATAMKLWPGVLAVTVVNRRRLQPVWVFVATLVGLCALVVAFSGFDRLTSPLSYQGKRGLQIESVAATPFMWKALKDPEHYRVFYAPSKSFEVTGPGVDAAAAISTYALLATVALCAIWGLVHLMGRRVWTPQSSLAAAIVIVCLMLVTNKVFSPQYLLWLAPLCVVALAFDGNRRLVQAMAACVAVMSVLTSQLYPFHYDPMITQPMSEATGVYLLIARNILLIITTALAALWLVRVCRNENGDHTASLSSSAR